MDYSYLVVKLRSGHAIAPERAVQNDISTSALQGVDPFIRHELIYLVAKRKSGQPTIGVYTKNIISALEKRFRQEKTQTNTALSPR